MHTNTYIHAYIRTALEGVTLEVIITRLQERIGCVFRVYAYIHNVSENGHMHVLMPMP